MAENTLTKQAILDAFRFRHARQFLICGTDICQSHILLFQLLETKNRNPLYRLNTTGYDKNV